MADTQKRDADNSTALYDAMAALGSYFGFMPK
jgi:hypothetical protein